MRRLTALSWYLSVAFWTTVLLTLIAPRALADAHNDELAAIEHIEAMAAHDRAAANQARQHAEEWRALERQARATNARITDPARKKSGEEAADGYKKNAEASDVEAHQLDDYAQQQENEAKRRRAALAAVPAQPPRPPSASQAPPPAPTGSSTTAHVEDFLGLWRETQYDSPFVIDLLNPDDPSTHDVVQLETKKQRWIGVFKPNRTDRSAQLVFLRKPKWDEMNLDIPAWARRDVEGKLEWKLEIEPPDDSDVCVLYDLKATWYPGEIQWSDEGGDRKSWVAGPGKPVPLKLEKGDDEIELSGYHQPRVVVYTDNAELALTNPIHSVLKLERFHVELLMSREEAEKHGPNVQVKLHASSGAEDTVEISTNSASMKRPVVRYTHLGALTIADYGTESNRRSALGPIPALSYGDRLAMAVNNGDEITVSIDGAEQSFKIYDTWLQRGIADRNEAFDTLADVLTAVVTSSDYSLTSRREADERLKLIQHARSLLNEPHQLQNLMIHDYIRYYIGKTYERLLFNTENNWYSVAQRPPVQSPYGFFWASPEEEREVQRVVIEKREEYKDAATMELTKASVYALYSFVASSTGMGEWFVLLRGVDIFGNPVDRTEQMMAAIGIGTGFLVQGLIVHHNVSTATSSSRINRLGARSATKESVIVGRPRAAETSLGPTGSTNVRRITAPAAGDESVGCVVPANSALQIPADTDTGAIQQFYPKAEIIDAPKELHVFKQFQGDCRFVAQEVLKFRATGVTIDPIEGLLLRTRFHIVPTDQVTGATTDQLQEYVSALNGKSWSTDLPMRDIVAYHANGFGVSLGIYIDAAETGVAGFHQVSLIDIEYGLLGYPKKVVLHDSNFPKKLIKLKVCDLDAMRARPNMKGPHLVDTRLEGGRVVRTLEMKQLDPKAGTVDLSFYSPDKP
jgi:hypothetical protein